MTCPPFSGIFTNCDFVSAPPAPPIDAAVLNEPLTILVIIALLFVAHVVGGLWYLMVRDG